MIRCELISLEPLNDTSSEVIFELEGVPEAGLHAAIRLFPAIVAGLAKSKLALKDVDKVASVVVDIAQVMDDGKVDAKDILTVVGMVQKLRS